MTDDLADLLTGLDRQSDAVPTLLLVLMLVFLAAYVGAVGGLLSPRGRRRAAAVALLAALGLCAAVTPWVLGPLLVAGAIGAVGLFVAVALLFSRLLGLGASAAVETPAAGDTGTAGPPGRPVNAPVAAALTSR